MEKILVVFYSFEGNTKLIGETIAKSIGADILELKPANEMKSKGFLKYVWGGTQVVMGKAPKLQPMGKNPKDYDLIFIGTPVWAWTYAPPLNTFFKDTSIFGKKIALFTCHGGQNGKTFTKIKEAIPRNEFIGEQDFFEPLIKEKQKNIDFAKKWSQGLISNLP